MYKWTFDPKLSAKSRRMVCFDCRGVGQTRETATTMTAPPKPKTLTLGSGCPRCRGRCFL